MTLGPRRKVTPPKVLWAEFSSLSLAVLVKSVIVLNKQARL